jgi:hypothetical protein
MKIQEFTSSSIKKNVSPDSTDSGGRGAEFFAGELNTPTTSTAPYSPDKRRRIIYLNEVKFPVPNLYVQMPLRKLQGQLTKCHRSVPGRGTESLFIARICAS